MDKPSGRLTSLDVMRGFTIAAMITVNFPGDDEHVYHPLQHTHWNGLSFTDLIAPFFLFVVGVSIVFAYARRLAEGTPPTDLYAKIVFRSLKIFAVGMFLNLLPDFDITDVRWTGTLHRIAIVFLVCALLYLHTTWKQQAWIGLGILVAYWLAMMLIPTPGQGRVMLEPGVNLAAWVDQQWLPGKMWQGTWDPEGILSTFPSIVTGITGMLAGHLMRSRFSPSEKVNYLMSLGLLSTAVGYLWGLTFPVNENLWTSSFVLVTSGLAALVLGAAYFAIDILGRKEGTYAGIVFGANAITVYVLADVLALIFYRMAFGGQSLNEIGVDALTGIGIGSRLASMLYALFFTAVNFLPAWWLYRKGIFIKL